MDECICPVYVPTEGEDSDDHTLDILPFKLDIEYHMIVKKEIYEILDNQFDVINILDSSGSQYVQTNYALPTCYFNITTPNNAGTDTGTMSVFGYIQRIILLYIVLYYIVLLIIYKIRYRI